MKSAEEWGIELINRMGVPVGQPYDAKDPCDRKRLNYMASVIAEAQADAIEAAAQRADNEEELDGEPDEQTKQAIRDNMVHYGRACVRSTKRCIAKGIRALKPEAT